MRIEFDDTTVAASCRAHTAAMACASFVATDTASGAIATMRSKRLRGWQLMWHLPASCKRAGVPFRREGGVAARMHRLPGGRCHV